MSKKTLATQLIFIILTSLSATAQVTHPAPKWTEPFKSKKTAPVQNKVIVKPKQNPVEEVPNVSKVEVKIQEKNPTEFSLGFSTALYMQAARQDDGTRNQYFVHSLNPKLKTENYVFNLWLAYIDQYDKPVTSDWDTTAFDVSIRKAWDVSPYFNLTPMIVGAAEAFKKNRGDFQHTLGVRLTAALKSKDLDVPNLILKYGLQVQKLWQKNEYKVDANGAFIPDAAGEKQYNTDFRLRQRFHLGYQFTEKITGMFYFQFDSNFLFDGNVRNNFLHETSLEYAINDNFSINGGLTNSGGMYTGDFQERDNLKFYNRETAEYFGGLSFSF